MFPDDRDAALLWDIQNAAKEILEFVGDVSFHHFSINKVLRYAVERQLIVIGEAAKKISEEFKQKHPEIPWNGMIAQRNIIAHEYGEVLVERIWYTAFEKIPELFSMLDSIVPNPPKIEDTDSKKNSLK